jgi:hypothetical protein
MPAVFFDLHVYASDIAGVSELQRRLSRRSLVPVMRRTGRTGTGGRLPVVEAVERWLPAALIAASGLTLVWSRLIGISQSLWYDELNTLTLFANHGPSGIWSNSHYIPGDHMLFMLLTWATVQATGQHSEPVLRSWSVIPAVAAVAVTTWWLWRRFDRWVAAIFAVLATGTPLSLELSTGARGYGLEILAGALMMVGADSLRWSRSRRAFWLFVGSAILGIWTLPNFVLPFIATCGVLLHAQSLRRMVARAVLITGLASLIFYVPVLSAVLRSLGQQYGSLLPWHGFISGPLKDLLAPTVLLLAPDLSVTEGAIIAGCVVAAGAVALWLAPERVLVLIVIVPVAVTYLFLELAGIRYAPRFAVSVILPLVVLAAAGLVALGRLPFRLRATGSVKAWLAAGAAVAATAGSVVLLNQISAMAAADASVPIENVKGAASIVQASGIKRVVAGPAYEFKFQWYLGDGVTFMPLTSLKQAFCTDAAPLIYLEYLYGASAHYVNWADTSCLVRRGAVQVPVQQRLSSKLSVWILPRVGGA